MSPLRSRSCFLIDVTPRVTRCHQDSCSLTLCQVSGSSGQPLFSSVSVKRRCYIDPIGVTHLCAKKRKSRVKGVIKVPAVVSKMADISANEYLWRKYGQNQSKALLILGFGLPTTMNHYFDGATVSYGGKEMYRCSAVHVLQ
uniref:Zn-cluster domain-containing protein n=1 Tax=Brassica campestris TaxID=3711 RepID=M4DEK5_BRACM